MYSIGITESKVLSLGTFMVEDILKASCISEAVTSFCPMTTGPFELVLEICSPEKATFTSFIFSPDCISRSRIESAIESEVAPIFIMDPFFMPWVSTEEKAFTVIFAASSIRIELTLDVPRSIIQIIFV